jgi:hypothetical protein
MFPDQPVQESPESASPQVTRAVAAGLRNEYAPAGLPAWQRAALWLAGSLPQALVRRAVSWSQGLTALAPSRLNDLSVDALAWARLQDYSRLEGTFPAIVLGAALGGAAAHLSLALGGPFLPQAFVLTLRGGSPRGDAQTYFQRSAGLARELARRNPGVITVQHYDPVHDGWITRRANHLRLKFIHLPEPYVNFLRRRLEPGGAVCYLDCGAKWLRYRVGERNFFQVGGWGSISAREFLEGSQRLHRFCQSEGLSITDWQLPGYPLEEGPESEWGSEPGLGAALENFCRQQGYQFYRLALPRPHDYSVLAFAAQSKLVERAGRQPSGVLVEMFSQYDATAVVRSGLLPFWLIFNTRDSLEFLKQLLPAFPRDKPVFFSPVVTFSLTPDMVPWAEWAEALNEFDWVNIGARPGRYPADTRALVDWTVALRRWVSAHESLIQGRLHPEQLLELAGNLPEEP